MAFTIRRLIWVIYFDFNHTAVLCFALLHRFLMVFAYLKYAFIKTLDRIDITRLFALGKEPQDI